MYTTNEKHRSETMINIRFSLCEILDGGKTTNGKWWENNNGHYWMDEAMRVLSGEDVITRRGGGVW